MTSTASSIIDRLREDDICHDCKLLTYDENKLPGEELCPYEWVTAVLNDDDIITECCFFDEK